MALEKFQGLNKRIQLIYSDNFSSIVSACIELNIHHEGSEVGRPQNNTIAENAVQNAVNGVRTTTVTAGLPACTWPAAGAHWTSDTQPARRSAAVAQRLLREERALLLQLSESERWQGRRDTKDPIAAIWDHWYGEEGEAAKDAIHEAEAQLPSLGSNPMRTSSCAHS